MCLNKSAKSSSVQMESDVEEYDTLCEAFRHAEAREGGRFPQPPPTRSHALHTYRWKPREPLKAHFTSDAT